MQVETPPGSALRIGLSSLLLGLCAAILYYTPPPAPKYLMVDELAAHAGELHGVDVRLHGFVHAGSIVRLAPDVTTFVIEKHGAKVPVWYAGLLPDTFKDQAEVIVRGELRGAFFLGEQL